MIALLRPCFKKKSFVVIDCNFAMITSRIELHSPHEW